MIIKVKTLSGRLPRYETDGSAGMDIQAYLKEPVELKPGMRALIPTGLFMEIPSGYEVQIRARSGLAVKYGIGLTNGIGTIDSDYRGEIKISLINWGQESFTVNDGDRIAQMVAAKYEKVSLKKTEKLSETERGRGGFGHTGI
ncbi:dUTP diphosphatase [Mogibacterium sp. NSJ-24]|jgi:dUTP pyrophosphatase|uniref:Deoxyuridine 5'-triphosphate nucleotidohydrolase n=1 Tax=Lentihominibacter hominis TaxID=2763645 RepID=A0A926IAE6_9FIRM|nr:dUTP diphosphatase [Lentihominibacter hominis]MBC8569012.1 dUTP diphosphatase [Lentihominibacter hominis]